MDDTRERSLMRLVAGFAAGMGLMFAGLPFAPTTALITPEQLASRTPDVMKVETRRDTPVVEEAPAPQTPQIEIAAAPSVAPPSGEVGTVPTSEGGAPVVPETAEVQSEPVFERAPEMPQVIVEVSTVPGSNELLVFVRPGSEASPPATDTEVATRFSAVSGDHVAPAVYGTAEPLPPAIDEVAKTVETSPGALIGFDQSDLEAPQIAVATPRVAAPTVTRNATTPKAPSAPDAPQARLTTDIEVSVNSFGQKPDTRAGATAGLLAAVTGADRTPRQASITSVARPDASGTQAPGQTDGTAPPAPPIATGPAFEAFAAAYEDTREKSLLSVILIDPGDVGMDRSFLSNLSFPVTFAIPADDPRARFIEAEYRKNGFEVLAMVPSEGPTTLNRKSRPGDVAALVSSYRDNVPSAIGLIDYPGGAIHQNSRLFQALAESLAETGQAVVTNKLRINNSDRVALAAGVPFAKVLRPIDADGSAPSVRRALDRAALTASQSGGAVVIGYAQTETVKALYEWLLSNAARSVSVAPVSAVIKRLGQD